MLGTVFRALWKNSINLIYPLCCLICRVRLNPLSDAPLCTACWGKIKFLLPQNQASIYSGSQKPSYSFNKALSVCKYAGIIKECIHLFKYKGKLILAKPLSKLMLDFAHKFLDMENIDLILPVPLHRVKQRQRQFNQAHLLAKPLSQTFSKEIQDKVLIKIKTATAQAHLSRRQRLNNIQGTFKVKDALALKNKNILLADDVLTTGATVNECAKALLEAGVNRVDVFTLARSN